MGIATRIISAAAIASFVFINTANAVDGVETRQIKSSFEDVYFDLKNAIVEQGLVVDSVQHVSDMLVRTGADVGSTEPIYRQAQTLGFCSAKLSRAAMEADPDNLAFCPYTVFIYEPAGTPGVVTIGYRKLIGAKGVESQKALDAVNALLNSIIDGASSE